MASQRSVIRLATNFLWPVPRRHQRPVMLPRERPCYPPRPLPQPRVTRCIGGIAGCVALSPEPHWLPAVVGKCPGKNPAFAKAMGACMGHLLAANLAQGMPVLVCEFCLAWATSRLPRHAIPLSDHGCRQGGLGQCGPGVPSARRLGCGGDYSPSQPRSGSTHLPEP